eukprot:6023156-Pleurochrysis_carterae.AAC.2
MVCWQAPPDRCVCARPRKGCRSQTCRLSSNMVWYVVARLLWIPARHSAQRSESSNARSPVHSARMVDGRGCSPPSMVANNR